MSTAKIAMPVTIDSQKLLGTHELKKGLIINGETGKIEKIEGKTFLEKNSYENDLLMRADQVVDVVTIRYGRPRLLPPDTSLKIA
jgi:hypothetical protein